MNEVSFLLYPIHPHSFPIRIRVVTHSASSFGVIVEQEQQDASWKTLNRFPYFLERASALLCAQRLITMKQEDGYVTEDVHVPVPPPLVKTTATRTAYLIQNIQPDQWRCLSAKHRLRVVWCLGEQRITDAAPYLVNLLGTGEAMLEYCLIWAIGRSGDGKACSAVRKLIQHGKTDAVRRVATWASMELAEVEFRTHWARQLIADWPFVLREAWASENAEQLLSSIKEAITWQRFPVGDWLESLDLVAQSYPLARQVLLSLLKDLPLIPGYFKAIRRLYKAAEFRSDGEIWALLHLRFERSKPYFRIPTWGEYVAVQDHNIRVKNEWGRADSRLAYSDRTRDYLRRRGWRTLRRLGSSGSPEFAPLAFSVLRLFDDAQVPPPICHPVHFWADRRWQVRYEHRHAHSESIVFNRLLFRPDGPVVLRKEGQHCFSPEPLSVQRELRFEPFSELWDTRPDLLLRLALSSRAEWVHGFAVRALADQKDYIAQINDDLWKSLLNSPFEVTAQFAYTHIAERIRLETDLIRRETWLILLLNSRHNSLSRAGLVWLEQDPIAHTTSARLLITLLTARSDEVRRYGRLLSQTAAVDAEMRLHIVSGLFTWLMFADDSTLVLESIIESIVWALTHPLRAEAARADYSAVCAIAAEHSSVLIRCVAVDWLMFHECPVHELPPTLLRSFLESEDARLIGVGVRLLGALPQHLLISHSELIASYCLSEHPSVRREAFKIVKNLSALDDVFSDAIVAHLMPALYRREINEGIHAHLIESLTGPLAQASSRLSHGTTLHLLQARSKIAQRFGEWLLLHQAEGLFTITDWVTLACCDTHVVRQRAISILDKKYNELAPRQLLPIVDGRWEDSRQEILRWLKERVPDTYWTRSDLIALADHAIPSVRELGCSYLAIRLSSGQDTECLFALSEHPSVSIQEFVANWLHLTLREHLDRLTSFQPYFRTVLSKVNRGRHIKRTLHGLLHAYALDSEESAKEVAHLFNWLSATASVMDKAKYIASLCAIQQRFPSIITCLSVQLPSVREERAHAI